MAVRLVRIERTPDVLSGQPVVRGTRLPVYVIVDAIAEEDAVEDLLEAYPFLERPERSEEVISDCALSEARK